MRNRKKKALYEVISSTRSKTSYEQLHSQQAPGAASMGDESATTPDVIQWVRKPRLLQFNAGRIEFSIPYQVGVAAPLGAILVVLLAFRLGERLGSRGVAAPAAKQASVNRPSEQPPKAAEAGPARTETRQTGNNRIVIQMFQVKAHLEPVMAYFDKMGVETEIITRNNWYYLVTKNKYDNPDKPGSDGYLAKQKIIEIGAGYKAPPGYETFGAKPFSGAFGMKFEE
jgi:hypothetical protein